MRTSLIRCLSLLCLGVAFQAPAQDLPLSCQVHANDNWVTVGTTDQEGCLAAIESQVPAYNAQGFKFGLWGNTLLSADRHYFYQSGDQGATWAPLRLKVQQQQAAAAPVGRGTRAIRHSASDVINSVAADAAAAGAAEVAMGPVTRQPAMPVQADDGTRAVCSLQAGGRWRKLVNLTLNACARELDRSPEPLDSNGFKYAYWNGVFLAANQNEVLKSRDRSNWEPVLRR